MYHVVFIRIPDANPTMAFLSDSIRSAEVLAKAYSTQCSLKSQKDPYKKSAIKPRIQNPSFILKGNGIEIVQIHVGAS